MYSYFLWAMDNIKAYICAIHIIVDILQVQAMQKYV